MLVLKVHFSIYLYCMLTLKKKQLLALVVRHRLIGKRKSVLPNTDACTFLHVKEERDFPKERVKIKTLQFKGKKYVGLKLYPAQYFQTKDQPKRRSIIVLYWLFQHNHITSLFLIISLLHLTFLIVSNNDDDDDFVPLCVWGILSWVVLVGAA